jgi:hypothetical protein
MARYKYGSGEAAKRREWIEQHLSAYSYPNDTTNSRFVYYAGIGPMWPKDSDIKSRSMAKNPRVSSQNVSDDIQWLIDHDFIDWRIIVDDSRSEIYNEGYEDPVEGVREYAKSVPYSPWKGVPTPVLVCEARAAIGALNPVAERYRANLVPLSGQTSRQYLRWLMYRGVIPVDSPIGCFTDGDKAGKDIWGNTRLFLRGEDPNHPHQAKVPKHVGPWTRLAVTMDGRANDMQRYASLTVQRTDHRFRATYTYAALELEALGVREIRRRATRWLDRLLKHAGWASIEDVENEERRLRSQIVVT